MRLWMEDLAEGQVYVSRWAALDAAAIKGFAAEYDPQPFHLEEAAAEASFFGGLAASGWQTAALTMRLVVESFGSRLGGGMIGAGVELAWPRPTRPGEEMRVKSEILSVTPSRSRPERGVAVLRSVTANRDGAELQVMTARLLVFARPDALLDLRPDAAP